MRNAGRDGRSRHRQQGGRWLARLGHGRSRGQGSSPSPREGDECHDHLIATFRGRLRPAFVAFSMLSSGADNPADDWTTSTRAHEGAARLQPGRRRRRRLCARARRPLPVPWQLSGAAPARTPRCGASRSSPSTTAARTVTSTADSSPSATRSTRPAARPKTPAVSSIWTTPPSPSSQDGIHQAAAFAAVGITNEERWVFTDGDGDPVLPTRSTRRSAASFTTPAVPRISFHDLRHTHGSLLIKEGIR